MKVTKIVLLLTLLISAISVHPVLAAEDDISDLINEKNCASSQRIANRAWSLYIAKNPVSDDKLKDNGAKVQALSSVLSTDCMVLGEDGKPSVNLSSLTSEEIDDYAGFTPKGPMVKLAKCLADSAPKEAETFIAAADQEGLVQFVRDKSFGAFPYDAFNKLLEASNGCGDFLDDTVKATLFYADINWYVRVQKQHADIITWLRKVDSSTSEKLEAAE